jgi:hypothetical protein
MTNSTEGPTAPQPPNPGPPRLGAEAANGPKTADIVAIRRKEAASRALAEAEARRKQADEHARSSVVQPERLGRGGLDPVRYGDWEVKGITSDF